MNFDRQQVLYDIKWKKFVRRASLFRHIPFVDFVFAAGSMAMGNVREQSDFDVLIGTRAGRIFTTRFFAVIAFQLFGWRRKKEHAHYENASDKVCLNHFVTEHAFVLSPPHNTYWDQLYQHLVPLYGSCEALNTFWSANAGWMSKKAVVHDDLRHRHTCPSYLAYTLEWMLSGRIGHWFERVVRAVQIKKIARGMRAVDGFEPRIIFNDNELEFHPDTRRIHEYIQRNTTDVQ